MKVREINEEVLYGTGPGVRIGQRDIKELKDRAEVTQRKRVRLCAHEGIDDTLHEMLIVHTKDTYVRPHKHLSKSESIHVIEGTLDLIAFDEAGEVVEVCPMGDYKSGRQFYLRSSKPSFHTLLISSEMLVFHEVTNGPFIRTDTIWAPWAPDQFDAEAAREYMDRLGHIVQNWTS